MNAATPHASLTPSLELAHRCMSWVLQFDYLSSGLVTYRSAELANDRSGFAVGRCETGDSGAAPAARSGRDLVRQYLSEIATRRRLSSSEEYRLANAAREGDAKARRWLIEHHLRLVAMIARGYRNRGLPMLDLIEEGNIGLMTAIAKFDPERGCRFSTYAKWWIRQSIEMALMTQTAVVRLPVHLTRALKRNSRRLPEDGSVLPASESNLPLFDLRNRSGPGKYGSGKRRSDDDEARELDWLAHQIAAPEQQQPDWLLQIETCSRELWSALDSLKQTERLVLVARYGLRNDPPQTLQSLARQLRLSSERVRQIQSEALVKLRHLLEPGGRLRPEDVIT
jgi:RNA polymerase nonessential primary-like sigma factor